MISTLVSITLLTINLKLLHIVGMNVSTAVPQDGNSDYGSDFTSGEEEILNTLLQLSSPDPVSYPDLLRAGIDDDENLHAAKYSYHGNQERSRLDQRRKEAKRQISVRIDANSSTSGKLSAH